MNKTFPFFLLAAFLLSMAPVRAEDEAEGEAPQAETAPEQGAAAAAAARNKGYRTEEATRTTTGSGDAAAPSMSPAPRGSFNLPRPRELGAPARAATSEASSNSGGAASSGGGISCEKGPKLTRVYKKEINFYDKVTRGTVIRYGLAPYEAASWRFKTPSSGQGVFGFGDGQNARWVALMMTVSQTPCDFDLAKAMRKDPGCYSGPSLQPAVPFQIAPSAKPGFGSCMLKPDTYYYLNIRNLMSSEEGKEPRDSCENELGTFKSLNMKPLCGGHWTAHGNLVWKDAAAQGKNVDRSVNDGAHVNWNR